MKREHGPYTIVLLDEEGFTLGEYEEETLRKASRLMKRQLADRDNIESGLFKIETRNQLGECLCDAFV